MHTLKLTSVLQIIGALAVALTVSVLAGCDSAGASGGDDGTGNSNGGSLVKWEVTGSVSPDDPLQGFAIDWSWTTDSGNQDVTFVNKGDMLPWTKDESLPAGAEVTLAIVARPDSINRTSTFVLDMELKLYEDGNVVDQTTIDESIDPDYGNGVTVGRELSATVGG